MCVNNIRGREKERDRVVKKRERFIRKFLFYKNCAYNNIEFELVSYNTVKTPRYKIKYTNFYVFPTDGLEHIGATI